ncbi:glutathione S-transferase [Aliiglaciecola sp. CAU 1673]|uniref:glutathione S-transferase family protein n=1 Tax=Aliiglaciecola sp. CAU 1673 TaxID=3032595 RepID=UPI0023DAD296|nr:glutathione S-transferase [Aliiglaciecola sp. CAU 1673]MDF2178089.1 glutathione S-transferase [Aliiglaciecola sp. CAU 1673]
MSAITLYRHPLSGHSHRVEAFLSILGLQADIVDVDLMGGAHKKPEFLQKNIFGQVPVLTDGDITLSDSNAILVYLASAYDPKRTWLPQHPVAQADVQRFLSMAAGKVAYGPAAARLVTLFGAGLDHQHAITSAHAMLAVLDSHLAHRQYLVGDGPTIADIANYAYIAHAPEGGVDLGNYANVRNWLKRIEALEGFVPMQKSPVGLCA